MSSITPGTVVSGVGNSVDVPIPNRSVGDYIQIVAIMSATATPYSSGYTKIVDIPGVAEFFQKNVTATGTGGTLHLDFTSSVQYYCFVQIVHPDPLEPSLPTLTATAVEGDGKITVNWVPSDPAVFASYVAKLISPAAAAQQTSVLSASERQAVFEGLTNGVEHTFRVEGTTV